MDLSQLKEPWVSVPPQEARSLVEELHREIASIHPIFGKPVEALARRKDCDDVLFRVNDHFAVVHLTWTGVREKNGKYPRTEWYESWALFVSERMSEDSIDYGS